MRRESIRSGFTLTELLIVIAIIVVVISLIGVTLRAVGDAARQSDSLNTLRQLGVAHASYSADHKGVFIPGYLNSTLLNNLPIQANSPSGVNLSSAAMETWVWRLSPYVADGWQVPHRDFRDSARIEILTANLASNNGLQVSREPAVGLNSIFIGGDSNQGGTAVAEFSPWGINADSTVAATRLSQVKRASNQILFTTVTDASATPNLAATSGHYESRAPFLQNEQWSIGENNTIVKPASLSLPAGLPYSRFGGDVLAVGYVDGGATTVPLVNISVDMRLWAPFAETADWRVP